MRPITRPSILTATGSNDPLIPSSIFDDPVSNNPTDDHPANDHPATEKLVTSSLFYDPTGNKPANEKLVTSSIFYDPNLPAGPIGQLKTKWTSLGVSFPCSSVSITVAFVIGSRATGFQLVSSLRISRSSRAAL